MLEHWCSTPPPPLPPTPAAACRCWWIVWGVETALLNQCQITNVYCCGGETFNNPNTRTTPLPCCRFQFLAGWLGNGLQHVGVCSVGLGTGGAVIQDINTDERE